MRKIGFCSTWPATDPNANSGYAYSMRQELMRRYEVADLLLQPKWPRALFLPLKVAARARGRYYGFEREPLYLTSLARAMEAWADRERLEAIVCPTTLPVTRFRGAVPVVVVADQVFPSALGSYLTKPDARYRRQGLMQEREALSRCAAASFPSRDACETALRELAADPKRVHIIEWGGNLREEPSRAEIDRAIHERAQDVLSLVFIGREWERKGGDVVLASLELLRARGVTAQLTIIGTTPPVALPADVRVIPFLDKSQPDGWRAFAQLMRDAHFHFVPSRAEAYGQVYCEAAAFGVPSVARPIGGVATIVQDGITGVLVADASPDEFASRIAALWNDRDAYQRMALAAREDYERRLNWGTFGDRLAAVVESVV